MANVETAAQEALVLINEGIHYFDSQRRDAQTESNGALIDLNEAKTAYGELKDRRKEMTNRTSTRGRQIRNTNAYNLSMMDEIEDVSAQIGELNGKIRTVLKPKYEEIKRVTTERCNAYDLYLEQYSYMTHAALMEHGNNILQQSKDYYLKLFRSEQGDCYNIREMATVAQLFNPKFIKDMTDADIVVTLYELTDNLTYFKYRKFNASFIHRLKTEMKEVVKKPILITTLVTTKLLIGL